MYDYKKSTWLNPNIEYLFNADIIEYDMKDGGFSLIKQFNLLPQEKIKELERIDKGIMRHIEVGKLQRENKEFSKALNDKFAEVRRIFIASNELTDNDIISVKKDAIFTTKPCKRVNFGKVHFADKNHYTSYIRLPNINNIEIYYGDNGIDVKGMGDIAVNTHRLYLIEFLKKTIDMIENKDPRVKRYICKFISDYKFNNLGSETYYLEFNNKSRDFNALFNYKNLLIPIVQIVHREVQ